MNEPQLPSYIDHLNMPKDISTDLDFCKKYTYSLCKMWAHGMISEADLFIGVKAVASEGQWYRSIQYNVHKFIAKIKNSRPILTETKVQQWKERVQYASKVPVGPFSMRKL